MSDELTSEEFKPDLSAAVEAQSQIAQPPQGEATTVDASTPVEPAPPPWFQQLGWQGVEDEAAALERVKNLGQGYSQTYQQAQYLDQQNRQLQGQLEALRQAQQQPAQVQPKPPEPPKVPWNPQQLDESYLDWIDPISGQWRENTPHQVVIGYQKQQRALREFQAKLYQNPHEFLNPLIEERAKALVSPLEEQFQTLRSQLEEQQQKQQIQALLAPYQKQFYAFDPNGQPQVDQFGNPVLTQTGQAFNGYTAALMQMGLTDPRIVAAVSALATERDALKQQVSGQQAAPAQPAQTQRQQQDAAIYANGKANGVNRLPNRGNTLNAATGSDAPRQNEHTSLEDELRQSYRQLVGNGLG